MRDGEDGPCRNLSSIIDSGNKEVGEMDTVALSSGVRLWPAKLVD